MPSHGLEWGTDETAYDVAFKSENLTAHDIWANVTARSQTVLPRPHVLWVHQLVYNTKNNIIICWNVVADGKEICQNALRIDNTWKHIRKHGYCIAPKDKPNLEATLKMSFPKAPITAGDLKAIALRKGQNTPIKGIRDPIPGYICDFCFVASPSRIYASRHCRKAHDHVQYSIDRVPLQTLSVSHHFKRWFKSFPKPQDTHPAPPLTSGSDLLAALSREIFNDDVDPCTTLVDAENVMEFYRNLGAASRIAGCDPKKLANLVLLPLPNEPNLIKLRQAETLRFKSSAVEVDKDHAAIRRLIVTTLP